MTHRLKGGVGLIAALGMKALKLETETDEVGEQASVVWFVQSLTLG
jgi:hypothetical protein